MSRAFQLTDGAELVACLNCAGLWTRQVKRGRKPKWCPNCRFGECQVCGDRFERRVSDGPIESQYACSMECYHTWRSAEATKRRLTGCDNCGKTYRLQHTDRAGDYCSRECAFQDLGAWHQGGHCTLPAPRKFAPLVVSGDRCDLKWRDCGYCGETFISRHGRAYCSDECKREEYLRRARERYREDWEPREFTCAECGELVVVEDPSDGRRRYCSGTCSRRVYERQKRARMKQVYSEPYSRQDIFNRDGWTCGICGEPVDRRCKVPHPRAATIDHIVPLADGGDDVPRNVQCAHFECNANKSTESAGSQLLLVG